MSSIQLKHHNKEVSIEDGELISFKVDQYQYIHQKGSPGWGHSDTEMFPIIGPTAEANFQVQTPKDIAIQDQHGLLREMEYTLISKTQTEAIFEKNYKAQTPIKNSKYPKSSNKKFVFWTYDFGFKKKVALTDTGVEITFTITGERDTPFMLGYHPAFRLATIGAHVVANDQTITLDEILAVGSRAFEVPNCTSILLKDEKSIRITTEGFGKFMLWSEVHNMVCIEPITFYPYQVSPKNLHEGFQYLADKPKVFKVRIEA